MNEVQASHLHRLRNLKEWDQGLKAVLTDKLSETLRLMLLEPDETKLRWFQARARLLEEIIDMVEAEATQALERFAQSSSRTKGRAF